MLRTRQSLPLEQLLDSQPDIASNLAQQSRGDVSTRVKRDRCASPVGMSVLPVRSTLPNLLKTQAQQERRHFTRFQNGQRAHYYATRMV
jgi:hypothetical protein